MKTPVTCEGCHRGYEVDDRFLGKTVKCANCGKSMLIPVAEPAAAVPPPAFGEYQLGDPHELAPSTFRTSPDKNREQRAEGQGRGRSKKKPKSRSTRRDRGGESSENAVSLPVILFSLAAIATVLALVAVFVPDARKIVGVALALPGLVLCLYGYASGVYIAFTEDDLYGWLFLLFPFYAAYYVVSRWDEMRSRLIMLVAGLTLLGIGGRFLEADRARAQSMAPEAAALNSLSRFRDDQARCVSRPSSTGRAGGTQISLRKVRQAEA
jgi:hypothetical protein